jgi:hypothetical protein
MVIHTLIGIQREPLAMDYDFSHGVYVLYHMIKHLLAHFYAGGGPTHFGLEMINYDKTVWAHALCHEQGWCR